MGKFFEALEKYDVGKVKADSAVRQERRISEDDLLLDDIEEVASPPADKPVSDEPIKLKTTSKQADEGAPPTTEREVTSPGYTRPTHAFDKNLVAYHSPQSFEAEQFRMLRTNILFPSDGKRPPRTILVTSALPGEGKSFVSSNLAFTISQNIDKHVLLMDCDMRRPTIHRIFGYENVPGLSNYLLGEETLPNLLIKAGSKNLSILPGGPPPSNPAELLSSNRMLALLKEVRSRYDDRYIIIDSPPPHLTAESKALAQFVDGIILVVKFNHTSREHVADLVDKFKKEKILGVVANWMDKGSTNLYGSGKYAQYSYYDSPKAN